MSQVPFEVAELESEGQIIQTPGTGANNETPFLQVGDIFSDCMVAFTAPATSTTLSSTLPTGTFYVLGQRVVIPATAFTVGASTTSYLDLSNTGVLAVSTSGTVTANSLRLWEVVSSATAITTITRIASTGVKIGLDGSISSADGQLLLTETGDTYGTVSLAMQNRTGMNGALFTNAGVGLIDFQFKTTSSSAAVVNAMQSLRSEFRSSSWKYSNNSPGEFQFGQPASPYFVVGPGTTALRSGNFLVTNGMVSATNLQATNFTTLTGTTSGSILWQQYLQGAFKAFAAQVLGYENDTATNQTIAFPTAFANTPVITQNTTGLTITATTTVLTITAPNATTLFSGIIEVKGF
jgi:hypothetical protein